MIIMVVKVCGITRPEDAMEAVRCGAGALGFVFWPKSPRFVDPYRARAIVRSLPPFIATVGVFVNQPAEYVNGVASLVGLSAVQLHGDEAPAFAADIRRPVIKAIAIGGANDGAVADGWADRVTLLLDADDPEKRGGTGQTIDWTRAAALAASRRVILSGGLTPDNVVDAIRTVRPFGIDVSSGVESSPGVKDHGRLKALFEALTERIVDGITAASDRSEPREMRGKGSSTSKH
jgi:phosphoribosylanthranilate isomerase